MEAIESEECDEKEASSDHDGKDDDTDDDADDDNDGGILFSRISRPKNGRKPASAINSDASLSLVYQPGAVLQCFELAVASHDDPNPATVPTWEAPALTNSVKKRARTAIASVDEPSDGEIDSSNTLSKSRTSVLRGWKPRALPEPGWTIKNDEGLISDDLQVASSFIGIESEPATTDAPPKSG